MLHYNLLNEKTKYGSKCYYFIHFYKLLCIYIYIYVHIQPEF